MNACSAVSSGDSHVVAEVDSFRRFTLQAAVRASRVVEVVEAVNVRSGIVRVLVALKVDAPMFDRFLEALDRDAVVPASWLSMMIAISFVCGN